MIAKVNVDSEDRLHEIIMRKVKGIEGIKNTLTMIIIASKDSEKESKHNIYFESFSIITQRQQFQVTYSSNKAYPSANIRYNL